jgi:hypothetical protein
MQRYFRTLLLALFAAVSLGACSPGDPATGPAGSGSTDASKGFAPEIDSSKLIFVVPVEGVNGAARLVLADAIAALLRDGSVPAILTEKANVFGPTIAGRIIDVEERDSVVWVTAVWELRAPYGTAVAEYRQQIVVDSRLWLAGSAEAINLLVFDAGPKIAAMVHDFVSPVVMAPGVQTATAPQEIDVPPPSPDLPAVIKAPSPTPASETEKAAPLQSKSRAVAALAPRATRKAETKPLKEAKKKAPKKAKKTKKAKPAKAGKPVVLKKIPQLPKRKPKSLGKGKPVLLPVPGVGPGPLVANPPPVTWKRPAFLIRQVRGAPGDGNKTLTEAMKKALRSKDMTVTEDPRQAGFVIEGRVEISPPVGGRQQAKIIWAVNTMTGEEVGKAVQENAVKAGSLNGPWGRIAEIVSNAAVTGIQELFGVESRQSTRRSAQPKFSGGSNLPQMPGRGPPPPR